MRMVAATARAEDRAQTVYLEAGELCVVPRGMEHRPFSETECHVLLIEPAGLVNTGELAQMGWKQGRWVDVCYWQRILGGDGPVD